MCSLFTYCNSQLILYLILINKGDLKVFDLTNYLYIKIKRKWNQDIIKIIIFSPLISIVFIEEQSSILPVCVKEVLSWLYVNAEVENHQKHHVFIIRVNPAFLLQAWCVFLVPLVLILVAHLVFNIIMHYYYYYYEWLRWWNVWSHAQVYGLWFVCISQTLSMKRNSRPVEFYRLCFNTWKINFSCLTQEIWCFTLCVPQFEDNKERLTSTVSNFTHKALLTNKSGLYEWQTLTWWISVNTSESESVQTFIKTLIWFTWRSYEHLQDSRTLYCEKLILNV